MNTHSFGVTALCLVAASLLGACSASRDVSVEGTVSAASVESEGKILLQFYDVLDDEVTEAGELTLAAAGQFEHELSLEGDELRIFAVQDADGDGACSEGEAWARVDLSVDDDRVQGAQLNLANQPCPTAK
ncbi:MAG TPA: hypothetical protein VI072_19185 [Polyangiaceae bacterium]